MPIKEQSRWAGTALFSDEVVTKLLSILIFKLKRPETRSGQLWPLRQRVVDYFAAAGSALVRANRSHK